MSIPLKTGWLKFHVFAFYKHGRVAKLRFWGTWKYIRSCKLAWQTGKSFLFEGNASSNCCFFLVSCKFSGGTPRVCRNGPSVGLFVDWVSSTQLFWDHKNRFLEKRVSQSHWKMVVAKTIQLPILGRIFLRWLWLLVFRERKRLQVSTTIFLAKLSSGHQPAFYEPQLEWRNFCYGNSLITTRFFKSFHGVQTTHTCGDLFGAEHLTSTLGKQQVAVVNKTGSFGKYSQLHHWRVVSTVSEMNLIYFQTIMAIHVELLGGNKDLRNHHLLRQLLWFNGG